MFNTFNSFLILFSSYVYFIFAFRYFYCLYVDTCFLLVTSLFQNCFMHELELENDRGVVETSFLFLIGCFYKKKCFPKNLLLHFLGFVFNQLHCHGNSTHYKQNGRINSSVINLHSCKNGHQIINSLKVMLNQA